MRFFVFTAICIKTHIVLIVFLKELDSHGQWIYFNGWKIRTKTRGKNLVYDHGFFLYGDAFWRNKAYNGAGIQPTGRTLQKAGTILQKR